VKTVLIADKLPDSCVQTLRDGGLAVSYRPGLSPEELREAAREASGIICRSGAKITAAVLEGADSLEAICRAGVGVDNIDVEAATRKGVVVMNTPSGNTVSTAEHAFALLLGLARNIGPAYVSMREGRWDKKKFLGSQLSGSVLGVIGLGRIGQAMARRAMAFGMTVVGFDPYISRETADKLGVELVDDLAGLLPCCDYFTLHVPENDLTRGLIGAEQVALMKDGARIINCARGSVVDQAAALAAVESGKLAGVAFDVYPKEPPDTYEFAQSDRVLATPHLGASTEEAQLAVAAEAAEQMVDALQRRHFRNALNMAAVPPEEMKLLQPYCDLATKLGLLVAQLTDGRPKAIAVTCKGELAEQSVDPVVNYGALGVLKRMLGSGVNFVSAAHIAEDRGIHVTSTATVGLEAGFTDIVEVTLVTDDGEVSVAGTLFGRQHPRIVRIGSMYVEVIPSGDLLVVYADDAPGVIGRIGTLLGSAGVNIARMGFGRESMGGNAILVLNLDSAADEATVSAIGQLDMVRQVWPVTL
jgi:D-3-phosphoglycerate dehydrogenase